MCWIVVLARLSDIFQAGYESHRQTITGSFMKGVPVVRPARSRDIPAIWTKITLFNFWRWAARFGSVSSQSIPISNSSFTVQSFAGSVAVNPVIHRLGMAYAGFILYTHPHFWQICVSWVSWLWVCIRSWFTPRQRAVPSSNIHFMWVYPKNKLH